MNSCEVQSSGALYVAPTGVIPAALSLSLLASNSAQVIGTLRPLAAKTFLLYRMPPPMAVPLGTPKNPPFCDTVGMKESAMLAMYGSPVRSTSVCVGLSACSSEPELYQKMSVISPVASLVLTTLSPSLPPGRLWTLIVTLGCFAVYASANAFASCWLACESSTRYSSVTAAAVGAGVAVGAAVAAADGAAEVAALGDALPPLLQAVTTNAVIALR